MKKLIIRLFFLLLFGVVMLAISVRLRTNVTDYLAGIKYKHELISKTVSPKIILVGGSNLPFGVNSKKISEHFNMPVVDMGLHGSIGLKYMGNEVKPYISEGDIVVMVPEYEQFYDKKGSLNGDISLLYLVYDFYPEGRQYVGWEQWMKLTPLFPQYASYKYRNFTNSKLMSLLNKPDMKFDSIYNQHVFDEYGDANSHSHLSPRHFEPHRSDAGINQSTIDYLNNFYEFVKEKKAQMYYSYPSLEERSYDLCIKPIAILEKELKEQAKFPILNSPVEYRMDNRYFFDTPYHLTEEGEQLRTDKLIADLEKAMGKSGVGSR